MIDATLQELLREQFSEPPHGFMADDRFADIGADSLRMADLAASIAERYELDGDGYFRLEDVWNEKERRPSMATIGELQDYISRRTKSLQVRH